MKEPAVQELHQGTSAEEDPQQGFYLEYVLQACPPWEMDAAPLPGPHVLEIILKGASLHWPYLTRLDFAMAVAETYSHCFIRPWAAPNPPVRVPCVITLPLWPYKVWRKSMRPAISVPSTFPYWDTPGIVQCAKKPTVANCSTVRYASPSLQPNLEKGKGICSSQAAGPRQWMYINVILETSTCLCRCASARQLPCGS